MLKNLLTFCKIIMKIMKITNKQAFREAIKTIKTGGVIICPTDTIYGFLADATNKKAVEKIFKIKKRPRSKSLPVFVKDLKMAQNLAKINASQIKILKQKWPGPYTFILKQRKPCEIGSHTKLYGVDKKTIALRIPNHKFLLVLLKKANRPLAQTSVNISGQPALAKIEDIKKLIVRTGLPMLIIDAGNLPKSNPSKIIDLTKSKTKILRK